MKSGTLIYPHIFFSQEKAMKVTARKIRPEVISRETTIPGILIGENKSYSGHCAMPVVNHQIISVHTG